MNNTKLTIWRYATTFAITFLSLASLAFAQSNVKMSNGDYQPGAVLVYQNGSLDVAVPSKIDRSETSYVLIHGAHTDSTNENIKKLARAIAAEDSDANILIVDWAYWSKFNGDKLEKIAGEQFELFVVEVFIRALFQDDVDMNEVIERHLSALFTRVFFNILPVEQTKWIPTVSERAYAILYGDTGDTWEFKTNGQTGSFVSLGLDPRKTRIIGHSHGAHVGGLVAARTRDKLGKMVKRLTALDPSVADIHVADSNKWGSGWNRNVADFVDVWRMSELCSGDKLYGDINVRFRIKSHPLLQIDWDELSSDEAMAALGAVLACELELHSGVIELFTFLVEEEGVLDVVDEGDFDDADSKSDGWFTYVIDPDD